MSVGIALVAARTGVCCGDQREPRGELHRPDHPGHDNAPVLNRLAERLDRVPPELGELVEKEDAVVPCRVPPDA